MIYYNTSCLPEKEPSAPTGTTTSTSIAMLLCTLTSSRKWNTTRHLSAGNSGFEDRFLWFVILESWLSTSTDHANNLNWCKVLLRVLLKSKTNQTSWAKKMTTHGLLSLAYTILQRPSQNRTTKSTKKTKTLPTVFHHPNQPPHNFGLFSPQQTVHLQNLCRKRRGRLNRQQSSHLGPRAIPPKNLTRGTHGITCCKIT